MKKLLLTTSLLALGGCVHKSTPEATHFTSNPTLNIEQIGSFDGCIVYRFYDQRAVHFVRCNGRTATTYQQTCGKNCVDTKKVEVSE